MSYRVLSVDAARSILGNAHRMGFIELKPFTRAINYLMSDEEYRQLQNVLIEDPERGTLITGTGGL